MRLNISLPLMFLTESQTLRLKDTKQRITVLKANGLCGRNQQKAPLNQVSILT